MWLYYIIISVLLFILLLHGYNKVKQKFWLEQPIFYRYNPINWCRLDTILSDEKPVDTVHLNFLNNNVSYVTHTNVPANVGNIYINEIDMSVKYYEDIVSLMNDYPYFNKKYNNGNMKFLDVNRKMEKSVLKILLENHDYDPIVTLNYKNIYKSDNDTSKVLSIRNIMGVIISIPLYCFFKNKKSGNKNKKQVVAASAASSAHSMPIYFSQVHYNYQEVDETDVTMMMKTYNYKMFHDWDEVIRRERDYIHSEKHDTLQKREINRKSKDVNKNSESTESQKNENIYENIYEKNGLKISKKKEKICSSIFIYTGINIPKMVVPFLEYHSFYIPITNWDTVDYRFHASIHLIQIGMQNINILLEYLQLYHTNNATMNKDSKKYARLFEVSILPSLSHIFHLIKSEIYSIYVLLQKNNAGAGAGAGTVGANRDTILAVYMFRKSNKIVINKNIIKDANHILHLPISIQMPSTNDNFFICGFINALKMEKKNNKIGCISIDTISHNKKIIDYFLANNKPILVEKNTLLIHNYICKTLLPENVVIMN
jgi:hypothetical protein